MATETMVENAPPNGRPDIPDGNSGSGEVRLQDVEKRLEVQLLEQEHRWVALFLNLRRVRREFQPDDPRRLAAYRAFLWKVFSPTTAAAGGVALVSICGLLLAVQANKLLERQNAKIDQQSYLLEAQRRAALITEFTSILEQIEKERSSSVERSRSLKGPKNVPKEDDELSLSPPTVGRIVALTRSYRPYRYLEIPGESDAFLFPAGIAQPRFGNTFGARPGVVPSAPVAEPSGALVRVLGWLGLPHDETPIMTAQALSPERGQLLITLAASKVRMESIIEAFADFSRADLRASILAYQKMPNIRANGSNFAQSDLSGVDFSSAFLSEARFPQACLWNVNFTGSMLVRADFTQANLEGAIIPDASQLLGANLTHAELAGMRVKGDDWFEVLVKQEPRVVGFERSRWKMQPLGAGDERSLPDSSERGSWRVIRAVVPVHGPRARAICG
jgi:hypothetical protein